ncbi:Crp/Fnr family transcriptional regulator [Caulobacter sp.]|jgi:CRP-like cAMP-binding protein|uniref:Crp/Fnr family transcriptional regulator n=1 Tax=Caulobacter sp. TaxID=78 RepID=UPI0031DE4ACA
MGDRLISKLNLRDDLTSAEQDILADVLGPERHHPAGVDLVEPGARPDHVTLLVSGFCGRYGILRGGRRVFSAINVAGDFIDLFGLLIPQLDYGVVALTPCVTASAPHEKLRRISEDHPHLTRMLWLETALEGAVHREWLLGMGQDAVGRLARFLCEIVARLDVAGLVEDNAFELPLTQTQLSQILGMTSVHLSRTLKALRATGSVAWQGHHIQILDRERLMAAGQFDPTYLRPYREAV